MSTVFLFPGQGSQFVGMGQALVAQSNEARAVFEEADALLGFGLSQLCFEGPEAALTDTVNQQPALYVMSMAMLRTMEARGWEPPAFVAGHSLGELSAFTAAGSLSFEAGLALVRKRGELMKLAGERQPGSMAAVLALDAETVTSVCAGVCAETGLFVQLANDNCPGQMVISGHSEAVELAMAQLSDAGARKVVALPITIAAHSALMASVVDEFASAVDATPVVDPVVAVISNITARPLTSAEAVRAELKAQLTSPVAWTASMQYLLVQGVDQFVEVGPGNVLLSLVKRIDRKAQRITVELGE